MDYARTLKSENTKIRRNARKFKPAITHNSGSDVPVLGEGGGALGLPEEAGSLVPGPGASVWLFLQDFVPLLDIIKIIF